jgi:ATP-dependent DNA helicase RecG
MNRAQLQRLVAGGESDRLEFKKSTGELKGGLESLCAFLNGRGGKVLIGVTKSGRIQGQQISDSTLQDVAREIVRLEPPATISQVRIQVEGIREVLVLETTDRSLAPYTYNGRPFRRIGTTTSQMPQAEYERRLLERGHPERRWENQPAQRYRLRDLDAKEIRRAVTDAVAAGRLELAVTDPEEALDKLKLIDGKLLQAAVVAFAKELLPDYPQCGLRLARFRGATKDEFLDQRQLTGHAFHLLREADLFLRRHLPVAGRFEPGVLERQDQPLFPPLALREALVNALCHRDYSIPGGAVGVAIYDDRLEISSTGLLPFGLTVADLKRRHQSRPRNPLLANVFYLRGLIERWGRGTQKIVELCVRAGHPEPEFEEIAGEVVVRFIPSGYVPPHRVSHDLTERQRRILHILRNGQRFRSGEILGELHPSPSATVLRDELNFLRSIGLIDGAGHGAGARWWLRSPQSGK